MTILVVDSALPLPLGTPRQRNSAARLSLIAGTSPAHHLTVDIYGTEYACRFRRTRRESIIKIRERGLGSNCISSDDWAESWLTPGRRSRLRSALERHNPEAIVIGDPALYPILSLLAGLECTIHVFDDSGADWHDRTALRQADQQDIDYHHTLAALLRRGKEAIQLLQPDALRLTPGHIVPFEPAILAKSPTVLLLASGYSAADRLGLDALDRAASSVLQAYEGEAEVEFLAIGFLPGLPVPSSRIRVIEQFSYLEGLATTASCVFVPWLSPELTPVVQEVLLAGTPVVTFDTEVIPERLVGSEGIIPTNPESLAAVFEMLLDGGIMGPEQWQSLASVEAARFERLPDHESLRIPPRPRGDLRVSPLLRRPEVLYNPLSKMLLLRLRLRAGCPIEEVRLFDGRGEELTRLMPPTNTKADDAVVIDGGLVVDLSTLGAGVSVTLHDSEAVVEHHRIGVEEFVMLEAELAWLRRERGLATGAFWCSDSVAPTDWIISGGGIEDRSVPHRTIAMPEIGGQIVSFSVPMGAIQGSAITLNQRTPGSPNRIEMVAQRVLEPTKKFDAPPEGNGALLESFRNIHAGKRAWVIGNGPSVLPEDLSRIPEDDIKFCFNRFYLSYDNHTLREDYVVSADLLMIEDFGQEMIDISKGMPIFCIDKKSKVSLTGPHISVQPFDGYLPLFSMEPSEWVSVGGSSVFVALQMALFMGLRDIVLYGMDYSFNNKVKRDPRYPFPVSFDDGNHFIESYRSAKPWCPPTWRDISAGFLNARVTFETNEGRILNATRGGKLTTFERADIDAILAQRK